MTDSLARDGQGGMTSTLPLDITGFNYLADINTGMRRTAADTQAIECGGVDIVEFTSTAMNVAGSIKQNGAIIFPVGGIIPYAGATEPTGWLFCYGQSLLRASYPDLFDAIGTAYGAVDGTHFSLPDLRGRIPGGKDNMGGSAAGRLTSTTMTPDGNTLAATGGSQTATLVTGNLPPYTPSGTVALAGNPEFTGYYRSGTPGAATDPGSDFGPTNFSVNASNYSASFTGSAQGGTSDPVHVVQPTLITNYIIFAGV